MISAGSPAKSGSPPASSASTRAIPATSAAGQVRPGRCCSTRIPTAGHGWSLWRTRPPRGSTTTRPTSPTTLRCQAPAPAVRAGEPQLLRLLEGLVRGHPLRGGRPTARANSVVPPHTVSPPRSSRTAPGAPEDSCGCLQRGLLCPRGPSDVGGRGPAWPGRLLQQLQEVAVLRTGRARGRAQTVPYSRSPASPRPGTM